MDESSCYGGGDIAGAVIGSLIGGAVLAFLIIWLYKNYWKNRKDAHLVPEDPENVKAEFAFDNPAFKNENKANSPLDTKWTSNQKQNSIDKRKTVDDTHSGSPTPRIVSLRGSDFTGLGIEICGGLKEGIFVKKVMPQGPAANIVNVGDKITSITIDLRHMVQEDATTILSYASPYNVQVELLDGKGTLPTYATTSHSPKAANGQPSLTHPLYRSSSQEDFNTIERNARKKLFPNDDRNYPTLKMEQQQKHSQNLPIAFKENEKKPTTKHQVIDEKLQNKAARTSTIADLTPTDESKKGLKFGIRVLPPNIIDKIAPPATAAKSPGKVQTDNENNSNKEIDVVKKLSPPPVSKRTKNKGDEQQKKSHDIAASGGAAGAVVAIVSSADDSDSNFERQRSINSSGIRRDINGIPQEMPNEMMQAALAARDNRKSAILDDNSKRNKGKAPRPPQSYNADDSTDTVDTSLELSMNTDAEKLNFTDNFNGDNDHNLEVYQNGKHSPINERKTNSSDTESQLAAYESDNDTSNNSTQIELNSNHITVHQTSEEESEDEERRTASLGDLSSPNGAGSRSKNGTLERAQSLEITDGCVTQLSQKLTPKKRKAPNSEIDQSDFNKEPRLMDLSNLDTLQRGRLKSAYEWGNLEDAIYDTQLDKSDHKTESEDENSFDDSKENKSDESLDSSMVKHVIAAAVNLEKSEKTKRAKETETDNVVVVQETLKQTVNSPKEIETVHKPSEAFNISWDTAASDDNSTKNMVDLPKSLENSIKKFIETESRNGYQDIKKGNDSPATSEYNNYSYKTISPIQFQFKTDTDSEIRINTDDQISNADEQVRIINYGTNMPDDVKVSRYPFGSLERPKSDVLKKLLAQTDELNRTTISTSKTTIKPDSPTQPLLSAVTIDSNNYMPTDIEPISLTFSSNNSTSLGGSTQIESDLTESSQISPVFSSDGQGVNSINISSMEVNIRPIDAARKEAAILGLENIVTISTDTSSQPSSIILIDDEKLDFTLRTLDEENKQFLNSVLQPKDEVFIIESLSSKKLPETNTDVAPQINTEKKDGEAVKKSFVTEIRVQTPTNVEGGDAIKKSVPDMDEEDFEFVKAEELILSSSAPFESSTQKNAPETDSQNEGEYIPRNSEIKFTTATYESPSLRHIEKRHSHIDQIRSNFEKNHASEIPVPVRKTSTSTPSQRTSPSKIPVFNSTKISSNNSFSSNSSSSSTDNLSMTHKHNVMYNNNLNNANNGNGVNNNNNRISVSVTSIKTASRHPSGK